MRIEYYPETDTLYIQLWDGVGAEVREVGPDVVADVDESGRILGFEIEHASTRMDLTDIQLTSLPQRADAPELA